MSRLCYMACLHQTKNKTVGEGFISMWH
uniref:Uncharacterized protein n=1 Tax=Anguilla anguilla TaxID=7936 RepID=A0A0E9R3R3_ANGAN